MAGRPDFSITMGLIGASTIVTGLKSTIDIVTQLIGKIAELAEQADAYGDVVAGHKVSVQAADEATSHLVNTIDLHRQAAAMEAAGLEVTSEQYRAIVVAATRYAQATGGDVTESVGRLTDAVIRGNSRGLRPFGIVMSDTGTIAERQREIVDRLTDSFGSQTAEIGGTQDAIESLQNTWGRAWGEMLLTLEREAGPIRTIINGLRSLLDDFANALETQRRAREHIERMGTQAEQIRIQNELERMGYTRTGERQRNWLGNLVGALESAANAGEEQATGARGENTDAQRARALAQRLADLEAADIAAIRSGEQQPAGTPVTPTYERPGGDGGGGGRRRGEPFSWATLLQDLEDAGRHYAESAGDIAEQQRSVFNDAAASATEWVEDAVAREEELTEALRDMGEQQVADAQAAYDARLEAQEKFTDHEIALWRKESDEQQRRTEMARTWAGASLDVYSGLVDSIGGLAGALAENEEEQRKIEGTLRVAQQVGALLYATTMAAVEFAGNNYVQGAAYTGAALIAGINLAKTCAEFDVQSKSGTTGSSASSSAASSGAMSAGRQSSIAVYFTGPVTSRRAREEVVALERDGARAY